MIKLGRERLKEYAGNVTFLEEDIYNLNFGEKYDVVVAVLSIHHLDSEQKRKFFARVYKALNAGGVFIIADIVKFDSAEETLLKENEWRNFLVTNLGEGEADYWFENYKEEDLPDSVNDQVRWMSEAGFKAKSLWEHINYAWKERVRRSIIFPLCC